MESPENVERGRWRETYEDDEMTWSNYMYIEKGMERGMERAIDGYGNYEMDS